MAKASAKESVILFGLVMILSACSFSYSKQGAGDSNSSNYQRGQLSYALVKQAVFSSKCAGCHGTSGGVRLESYPDVVANLNAIRAAVFEKGTMPKAPVSPLSDSEKSLLRAWIDEGAPELAANGSVPPPDEPLRPVFSSIRKKIIEPKCLVCHSPGSSDPKAAKIPVDTAEALTSDPELVVPGDPDRSELMTLLNPDSRKRMPPRRSSMSPLTPEELEAVRTWIQEGAKP